MAQMQRELGIITIDVEVQFNMLVFVVVVFILQRNEECLMSNFENTNIIVNFKMKVQHIIFVKMF